MINCNDSIGQTTHFFARCIAIFVVWAKGDFYQENKHFSAEMSMKKCRFFQITSQVEY